MENKLSANILAALQSKKDVRVPFNTFRKIFQSKDDSEFTDKLLKFAHINGLDYVIIFDQAQGPTFVRFWLKKVEGKILTTITGDTTSGIGGKGNAIYTEC